MKIMSIFLVFTISGCGFLSAQVSDPKPDRILEGGRLVLDLIKTLKPTKPKNINQVLESDSITLENKCANQALQICFQNDQSESIQIQVYHRQSPDSIRSELRVQPGQQACSYFFRPGIFIFEVESILEADSLVYIEKGELLVKSCEKTSRIITAPK